MGRFEELGTALDLLFGKILNRNFNKVDDLIQKTEQELNAHKSSTQAHNAEAIKYDGKVIGSGNTKQAIDNVQEQINTLVIDGDSSAAAAQAAIDVDGHNYGNLKTRLDTEYTQLSTQLADIVTPYNVYVDRGYATFEPKIVCFGDSNTRYYLGDASKAGSITYAFSSHIEWLSRLYPNLYGLEVDNQGYPGQDAAWAVVNFDAKVLNNPNLGKPSVCVLGFGTNTIKVTANTMESYLADVETLIKTKCIDNGIIPIVLAIPWYASNYGNAGTQARIPIWNAELYKLCQKYKVIFIDTYTMFKDAPTIFFNEVNSAKRHYSYKATKILGQVIFEELLKISQVNSGSHQSQYIENIKNPLSDSAIISCTASITSANYELQHFDTFECLVIPVGGSITINTRDRFCLAFYPRANATAEISGDITDSLVISAATDDGIYYPLKKYSYNSSIMGSSRTITITAVVGALYLNTISMEGVPAGTYTPYTVINGIDLAKHTITNRLYLINEIDAVARWSVNKWLGVEGYYVAGNATNMTSIESLVPKGYKFYNTQTNTRYRHDGTAFIAY